MCNLYGMTAAQEAMRRLFEPLAPLDRLGNLPPLPAIYPDRQAPILRNGADGSEMVMARWGMPTPPRFLVGKKTDRGVTNIRNVKSPHWRPWLGVAHRCLAPFTAFSERGPGGNVWFALDQDDPLAVFAGIRTEWTSTRKVKDGPTTDELYAFLTTTPNAEVRAIHPKAMPVILTTAEEREVRQRPLKDQGLRRRRPQPDPARLAPERRDRVRVSRPLGIFA